MVNLWVFPKMGYRILDGLDWKILLMKLTYYIYLHIINTIVSILFNFCFRLDCIGGVVLSLSFSHILEPTYYICGAFRKWVYPHMVGL